MRFSYTRTQRKRAGTTEDIDFISHKTPDRSRQQEQSVLTDVKNKNSCRRDVVYFSSFESQRHEWKLPLEISYRRAEWTYPQNSSDGEAVSGCGSCRSPRQGNRLPLLERRPFFTLDWDLISTLRSRVTAVNSYFRSRGRHIRAIEMEIEPTTNRPWLNGFPWRRQPRRKVSLGRGKRGKVVEFKQATLEINFLRESGAKGGGEMPRQSIYVLAEES